MSINDRSIQPEVEEGVICPKRMKCQSLECPHAAIHTCDDVYCKSGKQNYHCTGKPACVEYSEDETFGERLGLWQIIQR
jgi:hypothetical protein